MSSFPIYEEVRTHKNYPFPFHIGINHLDHSYPQHRHDFFELSLVLQGEGVENINGSEHQMKPGTLSFLLPHQIHAIRCNENSDLRIYCCMFDMDILIDSRLDTGLCSMLFGSGQDAPQYLHLDVNQANFIKNIFTAMQAEYDGNEIWNNNLIRVKLMEILIWFDRIRRKSASADEWNRNPHPQKNIWRIIQYVHTYYWDHLTLDHLSKQFRISVPHLSRSFKEHLGRNFVAYLHDIRIRHACSLLICSDMKVTTIAAEVGFESFKTFSRVFKNSKKVTPTEYRKLYANGSASPADCHSE